MPGNNLTLTSATFDTTAQKIGTAALNGGYGFVTADMFGAGSTWTMETWFKRTGNPGALEVIIGSADHGYVGMNSSGALLGNILSGNVTITDTLNVADGAWHHVEFSGSSAGIVLIIDGVQRQSNTGVMTAHATQGFGFRAFQSSGNYLFGGSIDEAATWSIQRHAASTNGTTLFTPSTTAYTGSETGLKALYHFDSNGTDSSAAASATTYTLAAPSPASGAVSVASGNFTITISGATAGLVVFTPSDASAGGTFTPATVSIAAGTNGTGTFTYTPSATAGAKTISTTNNSTLTNPAAVTYTANASSINVLPNDANLIYAPGVWDVTSARAKTINAGAYIRAAIQGSATALTLNFDVSADLAPLPQIMARVDRGPWTVAAVASTIALTLPSGNAWATRFVEIVVKSTTETQARWSTQSTGVSFTGITTTPGTCTTVAGQVAPMKVLVMGDSITEGVRTLNSTASNDTDRNDATLGWAYDLRHQIGAEVGVIGFGATGWSTSGSGSVPGLSVSYNLLWGAGPTRSFAGIDAIVINQGTNNGSNDTTSAVTTTLNNILTAAPTARLFVMRPFNGTAQATYIQNGIAACSNPARVTYVDTAGWWNSADSSDSLHPFGYANLNGISQRLAAAIRAKLRGVTNRWSHS